MSKLVYQHNLWLAGEDGVKVHLFKGHAFVLNAATRHLLELVRKLGSRSASMCLNHADDNIFATLVPANCFREHVVSFAYARRIAEEELEGATGLFRCDLLQPFFRRLRLRARC